MTTQSNRESSMTCEERRELSELLNVLKSGMPGMNRRELFRLAALAGGAAAMARGGSVLAAPSGAGSRSLAAQDGDVATDVTITVPFDPYGQPVTLDPHRTVNWGPFWVMFPNVWGGLLGYDENGKVVLDLAEDMSLSDDGLVYTFTIREGAAFASGNPVTSDAVIASWMRALDPGNLSPMSNFMYLVSGYRRYITERSDVIGFANPDERTVTVTLDKPYSFFPSLMASFVWSVIDPAVLEEFGDDEFVLNGAGTGPWQFSEFDAATQLVMTPNTNHYGGNSPSISSIVWTFLTGPEAASTALDMYVADEVISADVPLSLKSQVEGDDTLSAELVKVNPEGNVTAIGMDFNQEPFNDVRVRRAIAQAIDKDALANEIWEGSWTPATSFTPPVLGLIANYEAPDGLGFDVDAANQALTDAGYENREDLPEIVYRQPAEDSDADKARHAALLQMIADNIGVVIEHDTSMTRQQIVDMDADVGGRQFDIIGWWNLWETPRILNEVASPDSQYMRGIFNWHEGIEAVGDFDPGADAATFESITDDADVDGDEASRNETYRQAEELLLNNAVYIPLGYWIQMFVQKPYIQGTRQGPWTGRLPVKFDADVVVLQHDEA
ncbi:MAG: ABC transporter substrate-binding protein [Thermomicrobiales bacterium]|jgi:ABC-type transport system substrate-binding protein|nr:ABC transporter substrate-binding protein [Thermomicrobiales bacterium]